MAIVLLVVGLMILAGGRLAKCETDVARQADDSDVLTRAEDYLGLAEVYGNDAMLPSPSIDTVVGVDTTSAFLSDKINDKRVIRVTYEGLRIGSEMTKDPDIRDHRFRIEVLLDSSSLQLLKVTLIRDDLDTSKFSEVEAKCAERQVGEPWRILPPEPPKISLFEALRLVRACPWTSATKLVVYCWDTGTNRPADSPLMLKHGLAFPKGEPDVQWEIYMYSSSSLLYPSRAGSGVDATHFRCVISAITGKTIICGSSPSRGLCHD